MPSQLHREFLFVEEVADQLGYSSRHIRRLISRGKIRAYRNGRKWRVSLACVREYLVWRGRSSMV